MDFLSFLCKLIFVFSKANLQRILELKNMTILAIEHIYACQTYISFSNPQSHPNPIKKLSPTLHHIGPKKDPVKKTSLNPGAHRNAFSNPPMGTCARVYNMAILIFSVGCRPQYFSAAVHAHWEVSPERIAPISR